MGMPGKGRKNSIAQSIDGQAFDEFNATPHPIQVSVLPLLAGIDGKVIKYVGTAFAISNWGLLMTARHVLQHAHDLGQRRLSADGSWQQVYDLWALYMAPDPSNNSNMHGGLVPIVELAVNDNIDVAMCLANFPRHVETNACPPITVFQLHPLPPAVGEPVIAAGYHTGDVEVDAEGMITLSHGTAFSTGKVADVYHRGRDRSLAPFPCFTTNVRLDAGMSGGPVSSQRGVCGVVTSGLPLGDGSHYSVCSSIWPALSLKIRLPWEDGVQKLTLQELIARRLVFCDESINHFEVDAGGIKLTLPS